MSKWYKAEKELAKLVDGYVTKSKKLQFQDIDVVSPNFTYSCKFQTGVLMYNSILFEMLLEDTTTGNKMAGSFPKCKADRYAIKFDNTWLMFGTAKLKEYIASVKDTLVEKTTRSDVESSNKQDGRTYDRGICLSLTPKQLIDSPAFIVGINFEDLV